MMTAMNSAVSGMKANQFKMDVIGNNIANVNTVAYKGSSVSFQESFNQTLRGASSATDGGLGGTNPMQLGLGTEVASVQVRQAMGAPERTDNPTDMMIGGDGFFMVGPTTDGSSKMYTRAGNFTVDGQGNLVTQDGYYVLGYQADESGVVGTTIGNLQIDANAYSDPKTSTKVDFDGNLDANTTSADAKKEDGTTDIFTTKPATGVKLTDLTVGEGDDAKTCIARDTTISAYDSLGGKHDVRMTFVKTATGEMKAYEVTGKGDDAVLGEEIATLKFDGDGKITSPTDKVDFTIKNDLGNGAPDVPVKLNFSNITSFASQSTLNGTSDGYPQGGLSDFSVGQDGVITGIFSNGQKRPLGQVAIATFDNTEGMEKMGSNMYRDTPNSGSPVIGKPGQNGFAQILPGTLEMSNVDLGVEFTDMITTQRGFQANSRVISTADSILEELVNLKR